jgi:hypothetical protein
VLRSIRGTKRQATLPLGAADHVHQFGDLAALMKYGVESALETDVQ